MQLQLQQATAGLMGRGLDAHSAERAAAAMIDGRVGAAAQLHAFQDAYIYVALLFVLGLPLLFLVSNQIPGMETAAAPARKGEEPGDAVGAHA